MSLTARTRHDALTRLPYTSRTLWLIWPPYHARARRRPYAILRCCGASTRPSHPSHAAHLDWSIQHARSRRHQYATTTSTGQGNTPLPRKAVTVTSDDGRVRWSELSTKEKAARTTQQSFNLLVVLVGAVLTGGVITVLFLDVFSSSSKTTQFNRAVERVKSDARCVALLGEPAKIKAYGESTSNRWARNRPLASTTYEDKDGTKHLLMHFNVEGPRNKGVVKLHMTKSPSPSSSSSTASSSTQSDESESESGYRYRYLTLDVPGHARIHLARRPSSSSSSSSSKEAAPKDGGLKMFGVRWS